MGIVMLGVLLEVSFGQSEMLLEAFYNELMQKNGGGGVGGKVEGGGQEET